MNLTHDPIRSEMTNMEEKKETDEIVVLKIKKGPNAVGISFKISILSPPHWSAPDYIFAPHLLVNYGFFFLYTEKCYIKYSWYSVQVDGEMRKNPHIIYNNSGGG